MLYDKNTELFVGWCRDPVKRKSGVVEEMK